MSEAISSRKMYSLTELCREISLSEDLVFMFIERKWVQPAELSAHHFDEQDVSRMRLILELKNDFDVNDEGVDLILHLIDQIHTLRSLGGRMLKQSQSNP